jgi:transposase-like protein
MAMSQTRKRRRYTVEEIDTLLNDFERSGLSQVAYARRRGVSLSTLRWWLRRHGPRTARPRFLPVAVSDSVVAPSPGLELELGGERRIHIPADIDPEALRALLPIVVVSC